MTAWADTVACSTVLPNSVPTRTKNTLPISVLQVQAFRTQLRYFCSTSSRHSDENTSEHSREHTVSNTTSDEQNLRNCEQNINNCELNMNNRENSLNDHEQGPDSDALTHVDSKGKASMVDVGAKTPTTREATAQGHILLGKTAYDLVVNNRISKGDVLTVSEIAGIMGAKKTSDLIPLCHPLHINKVHVRIQLDERRHAAVVECTVACSGKTGVEMEALTGVTVALLTLYDMCKAVSKAMVICDVKLVKKTGGKSDFNIKNSKLV